MFSDTLLKFSKETGQSFTSTLREFDSYYSRLKASKDNWKQEWENMCSREFDISNNQTSLNKKCLNLIKTQLLKNIEELNSGKVKCGISSYPLAKNKMCINIEEGETLGVCTFTGTTLDILLGLIYLLKIFDSCN